MSQLNPASQVLQVHGSTWAHFCCLGQPGLWAKLTVAMEYTGITGLPWAV